jgi:Na+-transporting NADH:ubiquinone oxidoreductase subunit F
MLKTTFILREKRMLTHDVFELIYDCPDISSEMPKPGQYVMFQLAPGLGRAYSFARFKSWEFTLIIKRIPTGKGSPIICDAEIGSVFSGLLPLWHFVLRDTNVSKCFIWTWTGFAPLYCMVLELLEKWDFNHKLSFLYGAREYKDSFYLTEIDELKNKLILESYIFLSRETRSDTQLGYVTDWITSENIIRYKEFYICWSPAMVKSARDKLEALGVLKENIFFEQY